MDGNADTRCHARDDERKRLAGECVGTCVRGGPEEGGDAWAETWGGPGGVGGRGDRCYDWLCLVHLKTKKFSRFPVTSNFVAHA